MFRYALVLLLISPYYYSFGFPTQPHIAVSLKTLSNNCGNIFLTNKIREKIDDCNVTVSKTNELGLHCVMFYDINYQLCSAFENSKVDLEQDFNKAFPKSTDVKTICNDVHTWEFGTLKEFPTYKIIKDKLVNNQLICLSLCKEEDLLSDESNFYCKYFKWGSHLISSEKVSAKQNTNTKLAPKENQLAMKPNNVITTTTNNVAVTNLTLDTKGGQLKAADTAKIQDEENIKPNDLNKPLPLADIVISANEVVKSAVKSASSNVSATAKASIPVVPQSEGSAVSAVNQYKQPSVEEPPLSGAAIVTKKDKEAGQTGLDTHVSNNEANIESPKSHDLDDGAEDDIGNDQELEDEEAIGDQDSGIQDGDGQGLNDPKLEPEKTKSSEKKIESITSLSEEILQREIFPNTIQDTFVEDDDHFFPLFLTSVILVILLYILYHNKNKFTKMILGLIVEGRQSGRRRNSRGHSYRRLDTLEQAMSSNTAAPPSKIIY